MATLTMQAATEGGYIDVTVAVDEIREVRALEGSQGFGLVALFNGATHVVRDCPGVISRLQMMLADDEARHTDRAVTGALGR